jgi:hypothetical protein
MRGKAGGKLTLIAALLFTMHVAAQDNRAWTRPFPPFHIAGNLY